MKIKIYTAKFYMYTSPVYFTGEVDIVYITCMLIQNSNKQAEVKKQIASKITNKTWAEGVLRAI